MSAEADQAAATAALLNGRYESVQLERVTSFLGAHPSLVPLLEDLHCRLATTFPGARFVLRHLSSPRVPSPDGDGHLLVVVVPGVQTDDPSGQLSDLLSAWAPQQAATRDFLLVAVASDVVDPFAGDADALALYVRLRSEDYKRYLDATRRFVAAPPNSQERLHAATALSAIRHSHQPVAPPHQHEDGVPTDERAQDGSDQASTPR